MAEHLSEEMSLERDAGGQKIGEELRTSTAVRVGKNAKNVLKRTKYISLKLLALSC